MARTLADMTPGDARSILSLLDDGIVIGQADAQWALETIASMTVEDGYRIVPADSNGGKYETRRWTRHVTEWKPDAAS